MWPTLMEFAVTPTSVAPPTALPPPGVGPAGVGSPGAGAPGVLVEPADEFRGAARLPEAAAGVFDLAAPADGEALTPPDDRPPLPPAEAAPGTAAAADGDADPL